MVFCDIILLNVDKKLTDEDQNKSEISRSLAKKKVANPLHKFQNAWQ